MHALPLLHQAVLFGHLIASAVTLAAVLREDLRLLATRRVDPARLRQTMRVATLGLAVLWSTGLGLVAITAATAPSPWTPGGKLAAKLVVVTLLTLNGWALHAWVFPAPGRRHAGLVRQPALAGGTGCRQQRQLALCGRSSVWHGRWRR